MRIDFDHRAQGTPEELWARSGLDRLPRLLRPGAEASVLVVAAHPDDESLGAGGVISEAATRGAMVHVLVATDGEASHPRSPTHSPQTLARLRRGEVTAAIGVLAPSATVEFLGLPDGALTTHRDRLLASVAERVTGCSHVVSPWHSDGHPDHEVCAAVVREAISGLRGVQHWQYPIWAWHWARPSSVDGDGNIASELPWPAMRRVDLSQVAAQAKRRALDCHRSQHSSLSAAPGDEAILGPGVLAHFTREFETFIVDTTPAAAESAYFDALYDTADDPWGLGERFYERRKRTILLASLPRERFGRAFEPGCATGRLTAQLVTRCDEVIAWDGARVAVQQARAHAPAAIVEHRRIPDDWPDGKFDLIVLSEVAYYCTDLAFLVRRVRNSLSADGVLVACHWNHPAADHPHSARQVHDALDEGDLRPIVRHREADFLLDIWSTTGESVASAEGILGGRTAR